MVLTLFIKYYYCQQVKEAGMDGECSMNGVGTQYQAHNEQIRYQLGEIGIIVMVKLILKIRIQGFVMD